MISEKKFSSRVIEKIVEFPSVKLNLINLHRPTDVNINDCLALMQGRL